MAKKTSTNAVRKIDEQIKNLETRNKESKKAGSSSPTKKSNLPYAAKRNIVSQSVRDDVVVSPTKKAAPVKKATTPSKNVRGSVIVTPAKKKTTTKTIQKESVKNEIKNMKKQEIRDDILVPSEKKDLEAEVNKILGIEETTPPFVPLDLREEVVIPKEKPTTPSPKKTTLKKLPKVEETLVKEELETKIHEFLEKEDQKEISTPAHETSLDDIDVIKFDTKKEVKKSTSPKKKGNLKKKTPVRKNPVKKPVPVEELDKIEEFNIVEDIKKDLPEKKETIKKEVPVKKEPVKVDSRKNDFRRKRKGKGYVVDIPKKPYKELESDLRSLYDRVNDVVDDFEGPRGDALKKTTETSKKTEKKKVSFNLKSIFSKKSPKKPTVVPTKPVKKPVVEPPRKVKVVKDVVVNEPDNRYKEKPSILDHISQRVLNFFLIVLFTIFTLMVIAFIAFVIYVSTF